MATWGGSPAATDEDEPGAPALFRAACQPQRLSYLLLLLSVSPAGRATSATSSWSLASRPAFQSAPHTAAGDSTVTHRAEHVPPWLRTPWRPSTAPKVRPTPRPSLWEPFISQTAAPRLPPQEMKTEDSLVSSTHGAGKLDSHVRKNENGPLVQHAQNSTQNGRKT